MKYLILTIHASIFAVACLTTTGCSSESSFNFSQADMRAMVAGTWTGPISVFADAGYSDRYTDEIATLVLDDSSSYANQVDAGSSSATQSMFPRRLQCGGSRHFLGGCGSGDGVSTMDLAGKVSSSRGTIPTSTVAGTFSADGPDLTGGGSGGELSVTLSAGGGISASFNAGQLGGWWYEPGSGTMFSLDLTRQ